MSESFRPYAFEDLPRKETRNDFLDVISYHQGFVALSGRGIINNNNCDVRMLHVPGPLLRATISDARENETVVSVHEMYKSGDRNIDLFSEYTIPTEQDGFIHRKISLDLSLDDYPLLYVAMVPGIMSIQVQGSRPLLAPINRKFMYPSDAEIRLVTACLRDDIRKQLSPKSP